MSNRIDLYSFHSHWCNFKFFKIPVTFDKSKKGINQRMLNRYSYKTQSYVNFLTSNKVRIKFPPTRKSHFKSHLPVSNKKKKRKKIKATMGSIRSRNDKLKLFYIIFIYPMSDLDIISSSLR